MQFDNLKLFDKFNQGVCIVDYDTDKIEYLNITMQAILGYSQSQLGLFGANYLDKITKIDGFSKQLTKNLESVNETQINARVLTKSGNALTAVIDVFRTKENSNKVCHIIKIINTDNQPASLDYLKLQLIDAIGAKATFFKKLNHELKTPLNCILGYSNLMKSSSYLSPKNLSYVDKISSSGSQLLELINNILDVKPLQDGKLELNTQMFSIQDIYKSVTEAFNTQITKKNQAVSLKISNDFPRICADYNKCNKIVTNIFANAIEYTPNQGRIEMKAECLDDGICCITIEDNGVGISPEDQVNLFNSIDSKSIETINHDIKTGLYVAKSLVELHGGSLEVESKVGQGSKFFIKIPLDKENLSSEKLFKPVTKSLISKRKDVVYE